MMEKSKSIEEVTVITKKIKELYLIKDKALFLLIKIT